MSVLGWKLYFLSAGQMEFCDLFLLSCGSEVWSDKRTIMITPGLSSDEVAARLQASGIIEDTDMFLLKLAERGLQRKLQIGIYSFNEPPDLDALIDLITSGS